MKTKIEKWFAGNQNYQEGLSLLIETGASGNFIKRLQRGESKSNKEKLAWKLCEAAGLDRSIIQNVKPAENVQLKSRSASKNTTANANRPVEPEIITKIKAKLSELYNLRAQIHNELTALGKSNASDVVKKREELVAKLSGMTTFIDHLYEAKEKFFREKVMPDESVFDLLSEPSTDAKQLPEDPVLLMKRRNSLKSQITKANNKIKDKKTKPELKEKAEIKLKELRSELAEVEKALKL